MTMTVNTTTARRGHGSPSTARPQTAWRPLAGDPGLPAGPTRGLRLVGRREQRAALATLIDGARAGRGGAILVTGNPGSGKTHLLEDATTDAADMLVLRSTGVEVEAGLAFGTLQQLCGPLVDRVADLPTPQAQALGAALGLALAPLADPAVVGLGLVSLLAGVASERPVVCLIDDAQWVDESSAQAIGVASRRVTGIGVVILLASGGSEPDAAFAGLDEIRLQPLSQGEAHRMMALELPGRLEPDVQDRMVAEARGNPKMIGELGRSTTVTTLAGGFAIDAGVEVDPALEFCVTARLSAVPDDVTAALLLAAAEPLGDASVFANAVSSAGLPPDVAEAAEATGLVEVGDRVLFSHPLVRHVVYSRASDRERREAHRVLAASLPSSRGDHRAWHQSQACTGPSEAVADRLERASATARRAGGIAAAAAFLDRAAALSEEPDARVRRAIEAARLHGRSGGFDDALRLIAGVEHRHPVDAAPPRAQLAAAEISAAIGEPDAASELLTAAARMSTSEPVLSTWTLMSAVDVAVSARQGGAEGGLRRVAGRAGSMISPSGGGASGRLLRALSSRWDGKQTPDDIALVRAVGAWHADESAAHPLATRAAMELWDEQAWTTLAQRSVDHARRAGATSELSGALDLWACLHLMRGDAHAAESIAEEAASIARRIGTSEPRFARTLLASWRSSSKDHLDRSVTWAVPPPGLGNGGSPTLLQYGQALRDLASGRYEQALRDAQRVASLDVPVVSTWALPDVVEAATRSGRSEEALAALDRIRSIKGAVGSSWARGIEQRCLALLAEDDRAEEHFSESAQHLEMSGMRLDLARTHLLYGEWLRRQTRRVDARTPLRQALEVFEAIGAVGFARRASLELRASGEQARRRTPDTLVALTERESQVAELAIEGHSNPAIGRQLFISPRTVEYHLHKVFTKLGIMSRAQLRAALAR